MAVYVALLRGINVGTAKAVSMADLSAAFENLGFGDVKTLLRSGNVIFSATHALPADASAAIGAAVLHATGVQSSVLVIDGVDFAAIAGANPLLEVATDGSKSFVTFVSSMPARSSVRMPQGWPRRSSPSGIARSTSGCPTEARRPAFRSRSGGNSTVR